MSYFAHPALPAMGTWDAQSTRRTEQKRDEPHDRQQDATSLRIHGGETRRSGAKPQGRNAMFEEGSSSPKRRWRHRSGSRRHGRCRWRGGYAKIRTDEPTAMSGRSRASDESHERWSIDSTGTQERELWRRAKLERAGFLKVMATSSAGNAVEGRKPSRVRQVTGKTGEGSGEVQRPATTSALTRRTTL